MTKSCGKRFSVFYKCIFIHVRSFSNVIFVDENWEERRILNLEQLQATCDDIHSCLLKLCHREENTLVGLHIPLSQHVPGIILGYVNFFYIII